MRLPVIHPPKITSATTIAISFGTKLIVCSWIDVVACKIDIISPTTKLDPNIGSEISIVSHTLFF